MRYAKLRNVRVKTKSVPDKKGQILYRSMPAHKFRTIKRPEKLEFVLPSGLDCILVFCQVTVNGSL